MCCVSILPTYKKHTKKIWKFMTVLALIIIVFREQRFELCRRVFEMGNYIGRYIGKHNIRFDFVF